MFSGVAMGAFGAHGLKNVLSDPMKQVFQTGVHYQLVHGLAILFVALFQSRVSSSLHGAAGYSFLAGVILFSGSLYILSLTGAKAWGIVTPIGGIAFLVGWVLLAVSAYS